jgi:hypothetical protein
LAALADEPVHILTLSHFLPPLLIQRRRLTQQWYTNFALYKHDCCACPIETCCAGLLKSKQPADFI